MTVLCIDVGTSSMRGILFDHTGQSLAEHQEFYRPVYLGNSWVEQPPSDWENALYSILKQIAAKAEFKNIKIDAISLTSLRSSTIPVDENIRPLCNAIMWQDKRVNELCERLQPENDRVFDLCGARINPVFSGVKMMWVKEERPEIYSKTYKFMVVPDYLIYLLTGEVCTDYTYGSRSNLMNLRTHQWDRELLKIFCIEEKKLCRLVEPGSICGYTTENLMQLTGFPKDVPVITAGGDQQCGALGQGVVKPGILSVTAGTGGFLITNADHVPGNLEQDVICNYSSIRGQYIIESSILTCCSAFDWFRKEFFEGCSFDELAKIIENTPPGSNGCLCVPYFMGRSTPDWNNMAKGIFANVTLSTTKKDMLRSLLEGICFEIRNGIKTMNKYVSVSDIFVNGGLTNSIPFNEMQANVYGMKIIRRGKADATSRGALMVALTAMGVCQTVEEAFSAISLNDEVKVYLPDENIVLLYEKCCEQMNLLYQKVWNEFLVNGVRGDT